MKHIILLLGEQINSGEPRLWLLFTSGLSVLDRQDGFARWSLPAVPGDAAFEGLVDPVPKIDLTDRYLTRAGAFARMRAAESAFRLAEVWQMALKQTTSGH